MKELRSNAVVVLVNSQNSEYGKVPKPVQEGYRSPDAGKHIPITVVTDPKIEKVIAVVGYDAQKEKGDRALREAERELKKFLAAPPSEETALTPTSNASPQEHAFSDLPVEPWKSGAGSSLQARLTRVSGNSVSLVAADGRTISITRDQLHADSQKRLDDLIATKTKDGSKP
ncbi:MAG: hypothetical protein ACR2OZ_00440 [Verrucomicrobiales bacterium]